MSTMTFFALTVVAFAVTSTIALFIDRKVESK